MRDRAVTLFGQDEVRRRSGQRLRYHLFGHLGQLSPDDDRTGSTGGTGAILCGLIGGCGDDSIVPAREPDANDLAECPKHAPDNPVGSDARSLKTRQILGGCGVLAVRLLGNGESWLRTN